MVDEGATIVSEGDGVGFIGPYRIVGELGRGGMGVVYNAIDESLDRRTAVKVLTAERFAEHQVAQLIERQIQEAKIAASVSSPNLVNIYAAGVENGQHYIAMEFVEGESLDKLLEREAVLPAEQVIAYIRQAATGLKLFHGKGIAHRDIKPANLILDTEGRVRVTDFGLAKPIETGKSIGGVGSVVGTIPYLSPEQCRGEEVDTLTDIYALGVTMFEMLAGRLPFRARSIAALLDELEGNSDATIIEGESSLDSRLEEIVDRMMAPNPGDRYQSCQEVIEALEECRVAMGLEDLCPDGGEAVTRTIREVVASKPLVHGFNGLLLMGFIAALAVMGQGQGIASAWHSYRDAGYMAVPHYPEDRIRDLTLVSVGDWPIPDGEFGDLIDFVAKQKPAVIVLDFLLDSGSRLDDPAALAPVFQSTVDAGVPIVLATEIGGDGYEIGPVEALANTGITLAYANLDSGFGAIIRTANFAKTTEDGVSVTSLAAATADAYFQGDGFEIPAGDHLIHYGELLDIEPIKRDELYAIPPEFSVIAGKVVLIGTESSTIDEHHTALFGEQSIVPGMWVQGVIVDNLINGVALRHSPVWMTAVIVLAVLSVSFGLGRLGGASWLISSWVVMALLMMGASVALIQYQVVYPSRVTLLAIVTASVAGAVVRSRNMKS